MMHGPEQSRSAIVAMKPTNKAERSAAEPVERRAEAEGKAGQQSTQRAQYRARVSKALACLRRVVAVDTRGGKRMVDSCVSVSVRGASSNAGPYRARRREFMLSRWGFCVRQFATVALLATLACHGIAEANTYGLQVVASGLTSPVGLTN